MDERLPQYLHRPVQILWFGSDEFLLATSSIFVAAIVGGLVGWALIAALLLYHSRSHPERDNYSTPSPPSLDTRCLE